MNALIKSWAKLSFLFGIVGFELLLLPTMNLSLINDAHSIVFLSLYTISIILNFVTYHDSFVNQPIAMILSISFMCSTGNAASFNLLNIYLLKILNGLHI